MLQVRISQQGELVKIRPIFERTEYAKLFGRGLRGKIEKFTKRSRKNMLERFSIIDKEKAGGATFITLTYASNMQNEELTFSHLRNFLKRLNYAAATPQGDYSVVRGENMFFCWRKEYQERGAIHWHIMAFGLRWLDKDWLAYTWSDVIGENVTMLCSDGSTESVPVFTRVEYCRNTRKVWYYMSKYMAKESGEKESADGEGNSGFNIGSNLAKPTSDQNSQDHPYSSSSQKITRFWGWENRKNIPYASKEVSYIECSWAEYIRFRRDLSGLFDFLRQTRLMDNVKMFWFFDFLSPLDMFLASIAGQKISDCIQWEKIRNSA